MDYRYARSWMWSEAIRMLDEADRLRQQFFRLQEQQPVEAEPHHAVGVWEPPVDVYETEESWTVLVALPGVPSNRIRYRLDGDTLDIVAERLIPQACAEGAIRRKEIPHGRFVRRVRFRVPPREIAQAVLQDGCLLVTLRKPNP
jgi:HSP20 family molecular chaperone IbpA